MPGPHLDLWLAHLTTVATVIGVGCVPTLVVSLTRRGQVRCFSPSPALGLVWGLIGGLAVASASPHLGLPPHVPAGTRDLIAASDVLRERQAIERRALLDTGVTGPAIEEQVFEHAAQLAPLLDQFMALDQAQERSLGVVAVAWSGLGLFLARWASRRPRHSLDPLLGEVGSSAAIAASTILLLAGLASVVLARAGLDRRAAIAVGVVAACGSGIASMPIRWRPLVGRGRGVTLVADCQFALSLLALITILEQRAVWVLVFGAAAVLGTLASRIAPLRARARARVRVIVMACVVPGAAALTASRLELDRLDLALTAFAAASSVVFGDLLTFGAYLGIRAFGPVAWQRDALRHAIEILSSGIGPSMVLLAPILIASGLLDPSSPLDSAGHLAILCGAIACELAIPRARSMWSARV